MIWKNWTDDSMNLQKICKLCSTIVNHNINYEAYLIGKYEYRVINFNKWITPVLGNNVKLWPGRQRHENSLDILIRFYVYG
jgi:hypothetical protein